MTTDLNECHLLTRDQADVLRGSVMLSRTAWQKAQRDERAQAIAALGWEAEDGTAAGRYCASTTELVRWALEGAAK